MRIVLLSLSVVASLAFGQDLKFCPTPRITEDQWRAYLAQVQATMRELKGDNKTIFVDEGMRVFRDDATKIVYSFTQPGHAAHPALIFRQPVVRDGKMFIRQTGCFAGKEEPFADWFRAYERLNKKISEEIQKQDP